MCFKKETKKKEDVAADALAKVAGVAGVPMIPVEVVKKHLKSVETATNNITAAVNEVNKSIQTGRDPDMDVIRKASDIEEVFREGMRHAGREAASGSAKEGLWEALKHFLG